MFVNHVDSFTGRALAKVIYIIASGFLVAWSCAYCDCKIISFLHVLLLQVFSGAVVGASVVDGGGDGDEGGEGPAPGAVGGSDDHLYQVIGTLQDDQSSKPASVSDIVRVRSTIVCRTMV